MSMSVEKIAAKARSDKEVVFTSLLHHITPEHLEKNLYKIPNQTAMGIDKQSVKTAKETIGEWSEDMLNKVHRLGYRAPATRRVYIPKPGKSKAMRPIAVPTVQDRCLQKSVTDLLNNIYEEDFLPCSYGGRPKRNAHQAIADIHHVISRRRVNYVFEADLKNFFGSLNQEWVMRFLAHRVGDPRITCLIRRWMKAGVMEEGEWQATEEGTAQGGPISVLLSNLYLHYVLDLWIEKQVKVRMRGEVYYFRYLDDFVLCFQYESDANRFVKTLPKRLAKFSLSLEPSKTQLLPFGRQVSQKRKQNKKRTFSFLGLTFYNGRSRKGYYQVGMKTEASRLRRSHAKVKEYLLKIRHWPVEQQIKWLNLFLNGHFRYYGVAGNSRCIANVHQNAIRCLRKSLSSRSQKGKVTWDKLMHILKVHRLSRPRLFLPYRKLNALVSL